MNIEEATANLNSWMDRTVRGTLLGLSARVIQTSPVDTGRFRGNWQPSISSPDMKVDTNTSTAITLGKVKRTIDGDFKIGRTFYLTNNLPYSIELEFGSSKQAPNGVVRQVVGLYALYMREAAK